MLQCSLKHWRYYLLVPAFFFFISVRYTFNSVIQKHHLEPLFSINTSYVYVHMKGNLNFTSKKKFGSEHAFNTSSDPYFMRKNIMKFCPEIPSNLVGKIKLIKEASPTFKTLKDEFENSSLQDDGRYQPRECRARFQIAIVVPYRDRFEHLNIFLRNIHPFLMKQKLDYTIFIVEQAGEGRFNRGMLMNIGFVEAMKIRPFDCFIFHDVDLLPEDDRNLYTCPEHPRHMSVAVDVFRYRLPYPDLFGGVCAMSTEHFQLVNGFSNMFWGWGGEDDDMSMRIKMKGLHLSRYPFHIARYTMLSHAKQKANPNRFQKLFNGRKRFKIEGLNSLEYKRLALQPCKLFTWILVELTSTSTENTLSNVIRHSYFNNFFRL